MAHRRPPNVHPLLRGTAGETAGLGSLEKGQLYAPALREMLGSDVYDVALIPRGTWQVEPSSNVPPTFILLFSLKELIARVCAFVRNSNIPAQCKIVRLEDICIDLNKMEVSRSSGEAIPFTTQEFKTLKCFLLNPERVFSRGELLKEAWGYEHYPSTRTVDNHILRLRQKLERNPARPVHFRTVRGIGYKFVP